MDPHPAAGGHEPLTFTWSVIITPQGWQVWRTRWEGKTIVYRVPEPGIYAEKFMADLAADEYAKGMRD